jgi:hypothetical protein
MSMRLIFYEMFNDREPGNTEPYNHYILNILPTFHFKQDALNSLKEPLRVERLA